LDSKTAKTLETAKNATDAVKDEFGHGTHVAGIIAGGIKVSVEDKKAARKIRAYTRQRDEKGEVAYND
jgi:subtilisin family serine protease